ncbi:NADH-quinone oxidoreductase subunit A [Arthrobacter sp. Hz1]
MSAYLSILFMLLVAAGVISSLYLVARFAAVHREPFEGGPFLSGWAPEEHALSRYHARFYPLTMLFLAFDIEMLFMYPWAVIVANAGFEAVIEMFVFLGVLMVGVVWAWREGALRWT